MNTVFPPAPQATVAVEGQDARFPVRRIFCVGRNYAAHAREMGKDPDREPPFFFTKPADAVVDTASTIAYPPETETLHYEIELVLAIGREGRNVPQAEARDLIYGYATGIDLTRRDLQAIAKEAGRPWDWGKAFDQSAPCAPIMTADKVQDIDTARIWLSVNGDIKQDASVAELIWDIPEILSIISQSMVLKPGDLIFTGTPAGVGPIVPGDVVKGGITGLPDIDITIGPRDS